MSQRPHVFRKSWKPSPDQIFQFAAHRRHSTVLFLGPRFRRSELAASFIIFFHQTDFGNRRFLGEEFVSDHVIVFDLETIPDLEAVARIHGCQGKSETEIRELLGEKFPRLPMHQIVCIGAVVAQRVDGVWLVDAIGAPHLGERSEPELITTFVDKIAAHRPQLVTFKRKQLRSSGLRPTAKNGGFSR
jgi:hypothetical protein